MNLIIFSIILTSKILKTEIIKSKNWWTSKSVTSEESETHVTSYCQWITSGRQPFIVSVYFFTTSATYYIFIFSALASLRRRNYPTVSLGLIFQWFMWHVRPLIRKFQGVKNRFGRYYHCNWILMNFHRNRPQRRVDNVALELILKHSVDSQRAAGWYSQLGNYFKHF